MKLTPKALRRVAREVADKPFDRAAGDVSEDFGVVVHGRQMQRWAGRLGDRLLAERDDALRRSQAGVLPETPRNPPAVLVISPDGGRVQCRERNAQTNSRWREDKVFSVSSYLPGDGGERPAEKLVTTCVASMSDVHAFGPHCRLEAERRGLRQADVVLAIADCGEWIDTLLAETFGDVAYVRIADWYHVMQYVHAAAKAGNMPVEPLEAMLYDGKVEQLIARLADRQRLLGGEPQPGDGDESPRRVLARSIGYLRRHRQHMHYDQYRANGWPIGSGVIEATVKQINQRVKGTEQLWQPHNAERTLALRSLRISQDARWSSHFVNRRAYYTAQ